jgi:hypothetical protein
VRLANAGLAIVDGTSEVHPLPPGPPVKGRYTSLRVKRDGKWLIAAVRESTIEVPSNYPFLEELEWMLGEWIDESGPVKVHTSVRWSPHKNFLIRDFTVREADRPVLTGTQRVGWDPDRQQIKSWTFDSEGGVTEGLWIRDGDSWVIRAHAVLRDGTRASATNTIRLIDSDTFTWKSSNRIRGDGTEPDVDEVTVVRLPPQVD